MAYSDTGKAVHIIRLMRVLIVFRSSSTHTRARNRQIQDKTVDSPCERSCEPARLSRKDTEQIDETSSEAV
jgi:hypothetical protein